MKSLNCLSLGWFVALLFFSVGYANPLFAQASYKNSQGEKKSIQELPTPHIQSDYSRPVYDYQGKLVQENFWGCAGKQCIKRIEYAYNAKKQLIRQTLYYTGTTNAQDVAKHQAVTQFLYDTTGKLSKLIITTKKVGQTRQVIKTLYYDENKKMYGENGQKLEKIYQNYLDVLHQQLTSRRHPLFIRK